MGKDYDLKEMYERLQSLKKVKLELKEKHDINVTEMTVANKLNELHVQRRKKGRPRKL